MKTKREKFVISVVDKDGDECAIEQNMAWQTLGMWAWYFLHTENAKEITITKKENNK